MVLNIVSVVVVLGVLIFFHELGHFLVARFLGIGVQTFSLGFGPAVLARRFGLTEYRLSLVPLGGYVQMVGEKPDERPEPPFTDEHNFSLRSPWQRISVIAAGPIFNFILAWFIYWGLFWAHGQVEILPHIGAVQADSPAQAAGLQAGDIVTALNGEEVVNWEQMAQTIQGHGGQPLHMVIRRGDTLLELTLTPRLQERKNIFGETVSTPLIGITSAGDHITVDLGPIRAAREGAIQTWQILALTVQGLIKLIERVVPLDTVGGPIMIAQMVSDQAQAGVSNLLLLTALISINLGLLNLLPIPVLDGGHIFFLLIEGLTGKTLDEKWQRFSLQLGISFLVALTALAVINDVMRLAR